MEDTFQDQALHLQKKKQDPQAHDAPNVRRKKQRIYFLNLLKYTTQQSDLFIIIMITKIVNNYSYFQKNIKISLLPKINRTQLNTITKLFERVLTWISFEPIMI